MPQEQGMVVREAVAVFKTAETLQIAINELLSSGFDPTELSLMAAEQTVEEKLGHKYQKVTELEDDAAVPRTCYHSPESIVYAQAASVGGLAYIGALGAGGLILASGGLVTPAVIAAALAGGTTGGLIIGTVLAMLVGDHHARYLQEQLDHGGILLWVRTRDEKHERRAIDILKKHSGYDVHVHGIQEK
jgi:hypothetical protein